MREFFRALEGVTYPTYFHLVDAIRDVIHDAIGESPIGLGARYEALNLVGIARQHGWIKAGEDHGFYVQTER